MYVCMYYTVHPYAEMMFPDTKSQRNFTSAFYNFVFKAFVDPDVYKAKLAYLGEMHALKGVKATGMI